MSTSSTVGRTVEPITAVWVNLQSWHCSGFSLATQSGPRENCSNSWRLSVFASLGPQTALSSLPPLRFAIPASLAYRPKPSWLGRLPRQSLRCALPASLGHRPKPSVAWAFAGTSVHRTLVFFRLTHWTVVFFRRILLCSTISPGAKLDRRKRPEGCTPGMAGIKAQGSPLCRSCVGSFF